MAKFEDFDADDLLRIRMNSDILNIMESFENVKERFVRFVTNINALITTINADPTLTTAEKTQLTARVNRVKNSAYAKMRDLAV